MSGEVRGNAGEVAALAIPGELLDVYVPPISADDPWAITLQDWRMIGQDFTGDGRVKCTRYARDGKRSDEEFVEATRVMAQGIGRALANKEIIVTTQEKTDEFLMGPRFM